MPDYVEKTILAYDQSPDKYQASTEDMTPMPEFRRFVGAVQPIGKHVLDAGCAFGRDTSAFRAAGLEPIGIDLSDKLLRKAMSLHPEITFKKMDVRNLDFESSSFDGVWCHATLLHLNDADIVTALKEFHRVLKAGGVLFISFKKGEGTQEVTETFSSDASRFYNFKTVEAVTALLESSGFKDIDAYYINERELFGPSKRDLDWVHCFSVKA